MTYLPHISLFLVTFVCGAISYMIQKKFDAAVKLFLSFSGAFLLATCVMHLLPELFESGDSNVAPFILLGFFMQILIEYISQGVEHGHIHAPHNASAYPGLIFLGLCLHAFTEGLPLADLEQDNLMSTPLYWGILLHKLPIAIVLVTLFTTYRVKRSTLLISLAFFALLAPFGGIIGKSIAQIYGHNVINYFLAASTGIFLHISTVILFETSHNHRFNFLKLLFIIAGGMLSFFLF